MPITTSYILSVAPRSQKSEDCRILHTLRLSCPDDKVRRRLVYLKYWTLNLNEPNGLP